MCTLMIFDESVVEAVSTKTLSSTFFSKCTVSAIFSSVSRDTWHAASKPSATLTGCNPRSRSFSACSSRAPARTTTPVVPSPISSSWDCDNSTSNLATWCSTAILSRIVAPSFVMVTSPSGETIILSMPLGPNDVLSNPETDRAAMMLCFCACRPLMRDLACCSFRMMKGRPYSSKTMDMVAALWGRRSGRGCPVTPRRRAARTSRRASAAGGFDCWLANVRWQQ